MGQNLENQIKKYALQNALRFNGKANVGAVIGKLFAEDPELRKKAKDLVKQVMDGVNEVNKIPLFEQQEALKKLAPELLNVKVAKDEKDIFDFINVREGQKVVTAFPPEPSKYPHIGHAKAVIVNYELAKKHHGKFILRFEDTNPEGVEDIYYKVILENFEWLGIKPDEIDYASGHMEEFYKYCEMIIDKHQAYACSCKPDKVKENRANEIECECRYSQVEETLERWKSLFEDKKPKYVMRLKGTMNSQNTTLRDPVIFRVINKPHPRTKSKYKVWPTYDFESSMMDGIEGITHRLRSKEFELRNELQRLIQTLAGFFGTDIYEFARLNMEGVESSGRIIREKVKSGKLIGWDDPSLTTLVALRRRGFVPDGIKEFVMSTGLTKTESTASWKDLIVFNRRVLDAKVDRYFFIESPKEISVEKAKEQEIKLKLHPDFPKRGFRKFKTKDKFYVAKDDFKKFKAGKLYRLMDCLNFKKQNKKLVFDSMDYASYKKGGERIIHWLPADDNTVKAEVLMPDGKIKKGIAEESIKKLNVDDIVQFVRFGFCRLDKKEKNKLVFWYTHD